MQTATEYGRQRLQECRAIVGGYRDPFARKWAESSPAERVMLLNIARCRGEHAGRTWEALPLEVRDTIKRRLRDMREWLNKVCAD
jgi:hypothetical protein